MSRAIPLSVSYLFGIAGGIALIQDSRWGMYIVTVSYTTLIVTVVLGAWSTILGIEQRQLELGAKGKSRQLTYVRYWHLSGHLTVAVHVRLQGVSEVTNSRCHDWRGLGPLQ